MSKDDLAEKMDALDLIITALKDVEKRLDRVSDRLESQSKPRTITITVFQGVVSDVKGLPKNWTYKIDDQD